MDLEELTQRIKWTVLPDHCLGLGAYSSVYTVTEDIAVKVYRWIDPLAPDGYNKSTEGNAKWEFAVDQLLYEHGLQVPKMYGIVTIPESLMRRDARRRPEFLLAEEGFHTSYLFMERLNKIRYYLWSSEEREIACKQYYEQVGKAQELGFDIQDSKGKDIPKNVMWDRSRGKLYLHDFVQWKKKKDLYAGNTKKVL